MPKLQIDLRDARGCARSAAHKGPFHRHHKGHDGLIGRFVPAVARKYALFLKDDCVPLCEECHKEVHFNYLPIIQRHDDFSIKGAMRLRAKLVRYCNLWLKGKVKARKPSKEFLESWEISNRAMELRRKAHEETLETEIVRDSMYPNER